MLIFTTYTSLKGVTCPVCYCSSIWGTNLINFNIIEVDRVPSVSQGTGTVKSKVAMYQVQ